MKSSPERSCIICRERSEKGNLFRFNKSSDLEYKFDSTGKKQERGYYLCKNRKCIERLSKNKKVKVSPDDLIKLINSLKKLEKNYLNILNAMKNSDALSFGINMVFEEINKIHFIVIALDINKKNANKLEIKALELNIPFIYYSDKKSLGEIFNKSEVSVVGVKNKNMARGLID